MSDSKALTTREMELAILAWRALEEPKVDYEKLAEVASFKNDKSARVSFGPVRKKLIEGSYAAFGTATPKGKRAAAAAGEDGDDNPTPTKKPRGRPKKVIVSVAVSPSALVKEKEDDEDEKKHAAEDKLA